MTFTVKQKEFIEYKNLYQTKSVRQPASHSQNEKCRNCFSHTLSNAIRQPLTDRQLSTSLHASEDRIKLAFILEISVSNNNGYRGVQATRERVNRIYKRIQ